MFIEIKLNIMQDKISIMDHGSLHWR